MENHKSTLETLRYFVEKRKNGLISYEEMAYGILGKENKWNPETWRKFFYIIQPILSKIEKEQMDFNVEVEEDYLLKEIELAKQELFKERTRLQDQKREFNKVLREEARFERLMEVLKESIVPIKSLGFKPIIFGKNKEEKQATLMLSDLHIGLEVDNQVNFFNKDVAIERLKEVVDKTIKICTLNEVSKLNIDLIGDLVSGIINVSHRVEQEEDIITQIISCSEILSNVIMELDNYFDIVVHGVYGNHSRVFANKKEGLPRENFERLMFEYIKLKCPSIKFIDGKGADYLVYKVGKESVVITHGDKDSISNASVHFTNILGYKPDNILLGHIHHTNVKDDCNTNIIVNGSLIGADDYAVSLRRNTNPSQTLVIFGEELGVFKLKLK